MLVQSAVVVGAGVVLETRRGDEINIAFMSVVAVIAVVRVVVGLDPVFGEGTNGRDEGTGAVGTGVCLGGCSHDYVLVAR